MNVLAAQLANGVALGAVYALLTLGVNGIMSVGRALHFSFPTAVVLGMYAMWFVRQAGPAAMIAAALLTGIVTTAGVAPLFYRLRRRGADINMTLVASLALGIIMTEIMGRHINSGFPVSVDLGRSPVLVSSGLLRITLGEAAAVVLTAAVGIALALVVRHTGVGRAIRAIAEDPFKARVVGLPVQRIVLLSYLVVGVLAGLCAVLLSELLGTAGAGVGEQLALKVLGAAIIGGLGRLPAGAVAAVSLGVVESLAQGYLPGNWTNAIVFALLLGALALRSAVGRARGRAAS